MPRVRCRVADVEASKGVGLPALQAHIHYNPDVLSCLANLSNDEVFTPPELVNKMLDLLPAELWQNQQAKFLDPVTKSGVFLREIAKRLNEGLKEQIPDQQTRINHIFTQQLYGIAITELTSLLARRSVYCSKIANGQYSICDSFTNTQGNIRYQAIKHSWVNGKCKFCGASEEVYARDESLESHAYEFIHTDNPSSIFGKDMKFDVIIGNPPYQLNDGGHGRSAQPIYQKFILQAKKLNPEHLVMIIPDRWFAGGKGLDSFRNEMLNDKKIKQLIDYTSANDLFEGADVPGGICIFHREKSHEGKCKVTISNKGCERVNHRALNEFDTFIRDYEAVEILHKVRAMSCSYMNTTVSSRKPFGLATNQRPTNEGDLELIYYGGKGLFRRENLSVGKEMVDKWKVITSKTSYDHAGQPDKEGKRRVLSKIQILEPKTICTETYIVTGVFDNEKTANNQKIYLQTKFVRFLISLLSFSQDITKDRFSFVPLQNFEQIWTDKILYAKYGLTQEEIDFIESMIRPMELGDET